jgi:hypothetical protein
MGMAQAGAEERPLIQSFNDWLQTPVGPVNTVGGLSDVAEAAHERILADEKGSTASRGPAKCRLIRPSSRTSPGLVETRHDSSSFLEMLEPTRFSAPYFIHEPDQAVW